MDGHDNWKRHWWQREDRSDWWWQSSDFFTDPIMKLTFEWNVSSFCCFCAWRIYINSWYKYFWPFGKKKSVISHAMFKLNFGSCSLFIHDPIPATLLTMLLLLLNFCMLTYTMNINIIDIVKTRLHILHLKLSYKCVFYLNRSWIVHSEKSFFFHFPFPKWRKSLTLP